MTTDTVSHPTCPTCGCATHAAARTWEVACAACGALRWPLAVSQPGADWLCARCQATPPERRARRQAAAQQGARTRQGRAVTSGDAAVAPSLPDLESRPGAAAETPRVVVRARHVGQLPPRRHAGMAVGAGGAVA